MLGVQGIVPPKVKLLCLLQVPMLAYGHIWPAIETLSKVVQLIFTHPHIISCKLLLVGLLKCDQT